MIVSWFTLINLIFIFLFIQYILGPFFLFCLLWDEMEILMASFYLFYQLTSDVFDFLELVVFIFELLQLLSRFIILLDNIKHDNHVFPFLLSHYLYYFTFTFVANPTLHWYSFCLNNQLYLKVHIWKIDKYKISLYTDYNICASSYLSVTKFLLTLIYLSILAFLVFYLFF